MAQEMIKYGYEATVLAKIEASGQNVMKPEADKWQRAGYLIAQDFRSQHYRRSYRQLSPSALKPSALILRENVTAQLSFHPVPGRFFGLIMQSILQSHWQVITAIDTPDVKQPLVNIEEISAAGTPQSLIFARSYHDSTTASLFKGMKAKRLSLTLNHNSAPVIEASFLGITRSERRGEAQIADIVSAPASAGEVPPVPQVTRARVMINGKQISLLQSVVLHLSKPDLRAVYVMTKKSPSQLVDGKLAITGRLSFLVTNRVLAALPKAGEGVSVNLALAYAERHQIVIKIARASVTDLQLSPPTSDSLITANLEFEITENHKLVAPLRLSQSYT